VCADGGGIGISGCRYRDRDGHHVSQGLHPCSCTFVSRLGWLRGRPASSKASLAEFTSLRTGALAEILKLLLTTAVGLLSLGGILLMIVMAICLFTGFRKLMNQDPGKEGWN
jgi:hypothetical protein